MCIDGDLLYGCAIYVDEMYVFDISDKSNPSLISTWPGIPKAHACWVSEDSRTVFTGSETTGGHIMSWDVSDLSNVEFLDAWLPDGERTGLLIMFLFLMICSTSVTIFMDFRY